MEQLNGVYNEQEVLMNKIVTSESRHVIHGLLLFNVDNLTKLNELIGVEKADEVLGLVNDKVKNFFRGTDIVARLKWGEYAVLIQNPNAINDIEKIAEKVLKSISEVIVPDYRISASIGISVYPFHGKTYEELKTNAYQALRRAKSNGKDCYRLYEAALTKAKFSNFLFEGNYDDFDYRNLNESAWDKYFMDVSLQLFHYDSNIYTSMNSLMEIFCLYHGYNRAFIVSDFEHSTYDLKNMEFTLPGFELPKSEIADVIKKDLVVRLYDEYGDFGLVRKDFPASDVEIMTFMSDTGANELLYFAIKNDDDFSGAIVFANAEDEYSKVNELNLDKLSMQISAIINYAMISKTYRASKETLSKIEMFEGMGANVYLIDANTNVIEYMNENAVQNGGEFIVGKKCYKTLQKSECRCEDCPLANMDIDDSKANQRKDSFNYATNRWSVNLYSWVSGRDNKGKTLLLSIDMENMFDTLKEQ